MLDIFKGIVKRIKFEHLFAFAMFVPMMVLMNFGMDTSNETIITTVSTMIATGFGMIVTRFFKKDDVDSNK